MNAQILGTTFLENLIANTLTVNRASFGDGDIKTGADINADKLEHRVHAVYQLPDGADVAATSGDGVPIYTCVRTNGATIKGVHVICPDAPEGGDKTFSVDIKKASAGSAAATVLTAAVTYPAGTPDYTMRTGTVASANLANGDTLLVSVAVSGSTGNQGQGLLVLVVLDEKAV